MTSKVQIVDVEPRAREMVGEAPRGQVPCVSVLPEAVYEEHDRLRIGSAGLDVHPLVRGAGPALADNGKRDLTGRDEDFLSEGPSLASIDDLLGDSSVENQRGLSAQFPPRLEKLM